MSTVQLVSETTDNATSLAINSGNVFWTGSADTNTGFVRVYNIAGNTVTTLAASQDLPFDSPGIAADSTTVAWISREGLMAMPVAGGAITTVNANRPTALAMNALSLLWTNSSWASSNFGVFEITPP